MLDRVNDIIKTPGKIVFDPTNVNTALRVPLYSGDEGLNWEILPELVRMPNLIFGGTSDIVVARMAKATIAPTAFTSAALAKVFTHQGVYAARPGGSIIGATDKLVDIVTMDGQARRMACGFIYAEPPLRCETGKTIMGEMTIYGIVGLDGDANDLDDLLTLENQAWSDADYNAAHMITPGWTFSYAVDEEDESSWADIETRAGVTITSKSELDEDSNKTSGKGLRNVSISGYSVTVAADVFNITEAQVRAARFGDGTQAMGTRANVNGRDIKLNAIGGGGYIRVKNAVVQSSQFRAHPQKTVVGELTWKSDPVNSRTHLVVSTTDPDA